jgi:AcrR family transcriptional regulator
MSAVAVEAGVATGTAYVHYASKDELVVAAYLELKHDLGLAAVRQVDPAAAPRVRFGQLWRGVYRYLAADPDRARFLVQVDGSPYATDALARAMERDDDPVIVAATTPDMAAVLAPLPLEVLYDLGLGPAVRLAASERSLTRRQLTALVEASWRAITSA